MEWYKNETKTIKMATTFKSVGSEQRMDQKTFQPSEIIINNKEAKHNE